MWVELALAAATTERIALGPGVTNPATRHPAVTASTAATLQAESGGRAVFGIGRGDFGPHAARARARARRRAGAGHAERLDFTVGAEPKRLGWALDSARAAAGGRELSFGAYLNVAVDDDLAAARDLVRGSTAIFARFATEGAPADGLSEVTRAGIEGLASTYDESRHGHADAPHARALEDDFIDRFAVVGNVAEVARRLT